MQVKYSPKFPPAGPMPNTRRQTEYIHKVCICVQGLQALCVQGLQALQTKKKSVRGSEAARREPCISAIFRTCWRGGLNLPCAFWTVRHAQDDFTVSSVTTYSLQKHTYVNFFSAKNEECLKTNLHFAIKIRCDYKKVSFVFFSLYCIPYLLHVPES
jgi:hypothetical protein